MMHPRPNQAGPDESPTADLYQRHAPALFAYLRSKQLSREDAEDVLLEVFLASFERVALSARPEAEQWAWLRQVAYYKLADHYRRAKKQPIVALDAVADTLYADEARQPEQVTLQREAEDRLRDLVSRLPAAQQQVLRLHFGQGLRCVEIARMQGKGEGAVRMVLSRALNLLRTYYTER